MTPDEPKRYRVTWWKRGEAKAREIEVTATGPGAARKADGLQLGITPANRYQWSDLPTAKEITEEATS